MVSVIIPNYNHAQYLDERIQSVLNQTYKDFEVIILDDCSTDNSLEVINKYKNYPHVTQIVVNKPNCGSPFKQWHKGFELAKGDIIWIAESDDYCEPTFLERLTTAMSQREDCVVAFCKILSFEPNGCKRISTPLELQEGIYESKIFISDFMSWHPTIVNASGAIFKRSIAMAIDNRYLNFRGAGDRMFWVEMAEQGSIAYVDIPLNYFRQHNSNSSSRNFNSGTNQREDKIILDYIYQKGFINDEKYNHCRTRYIHRWILPISNQILRFQLLTIWEPKFSKRLRFLYAVSKIRLFLRSILGKKDTDKC